MAYDPDTIRNFSKRLLALYPCDFKERLEESMLQTFNDLYKEGQTEGRWFGFVLWMFVETAMGIVREHLLILLEGDVMKNVHVNPRSAALIAFLFTLPFMVLNTIAGKQIEPFFSIFEVNTAGGFWDHPVGHVSLVVALLLLPIGAIIALWPIFQKGADGRRKLHLMNILLAAALLCLFFLISGALLEEIYRCNILLIPNCD